MRTIRLELETISTRQALHRYLQQALALPAYYGGNLDALYDCLGEVSQPLCLSLPPAAAEEAYLGGYGPRLRQVLEEAAAANPNLQLRWEEKGP